MNNFVGGEPDCRLKLPILSVGYPIPYLGLLNHRDPAYSTLLEFDLHLFVRYFIISSITTLKLVVRGISAKDL